MAQDSEGHKSGAVRMATQDFEAFKAANSHYDSIEVLPTKTKSGGGCCSRLKQAAAPLSGVLLLLVSTVFVSLSGVFVKRATRRGIPASQVMLFRCIIQFIFGYVYCSLRDAGGPFGAKKDRGYLFLRGALHSTSLALFYFAITGMSLGGATAIYSPQPFFGALAAFLWLGETVKPSSLITGALSVCGVIMVAAPKFIFGDHSPPETVGNEYWAPMVALLGSVLGGLQLTVVRKIGFNASPIQMLFWFGLAGIVIFSPISYLKFTQNVADQFKEYGTWLDLVAVSVTSFIAQAALNAGMQREKIGVGAFIRNMSTVFAFILQVTVLNQPIKELSAAGSAVIVCASGVVMVDKMLTDRRLRMAAAKRAATESV